MPSKSYYDEETYLSYTLEGQTQTREVEAPGEVIRLVLPLKRPVRPLGQASFHHRVARLTDKRTLADVMKKLSILEKAQPKFTEGHSFFTVMLDLSVSMKFPVKTYLEFARFSIRLCKESDILAIDPTTKGVAGTLTKSGEHGIDFGLDLALTSELGLETKYSSKSGWVCKIPVFFEEVKGAILGSNQVQWDIYGKRNVPILGTRVGTTSVVRAILIVRLPEGADCKAKVVVEGSVVRERLLFFDMEGPVKLICPSKFDVLRQE